jgi:hypothetical protein
LIIGCGCRGCSLASELRARGHAVRGTTRSRERLEEIEATGAQGLLGDPDRIATIAPACAHVSVACVLLGSVGGSSEQIRALHGPRLEMLLARMLDTTVRGLVYEAAGTVAEAVLRSGAEIVRDGCERSRIPYVLLDANPDDRRAWLLAATAAVDRVLKAA